MLMRLDPLHRRKRGASNETNGIELRTVVATFMQVDRIDVGPAKDVQSKGGSQKTE
jgi:hypothetical protein